MRNTYFENEPEDQRYAYASSLVRCFENNLLDEVKVERLLEAEDVNEVIRLLQDTPYGPFITPGKYEGNYEKILFGRRLEVYKFFDKYCIDDLPKEFIHAPFDYSNLKLILKKQILILEKKIEEKQEYKMFSPLGNVSKEIFLSEEEENILLPKHIDNTMKEAMEKYYSTKDPRILDMVCDINLYKYLKNIVMKMKSPFMKELLEVMVDGINISSLIRLRNFPDAEEIADYVFTEGGSVNPNVWRYKYNLPIEELKSILNSYELSEYSEVIDKKTEEVEKTADSLFANLLRQSRFFLSGVEILISFVFSVEQEVKILRKIFVGKENSIPSVKIKSRLSEVI